MEKRNDQSFLIHKTTQRIVCERIEHKPPESYRSSNVDKSIEWISITLGTTKNVRLSPTHEYGFFLFLCSVAVVVILLWPNNNQFCSDACRTDHKLFPKTRKKNENEMEQLYVSEKTRAKKGKNRSDNWIHRCPRFTTDSLIRKWLMISWNQSEPKSTDKTR